MESRTLCFLITNAEMAFIGLAIPSDTIRALMNSVNGLIGLTFKPAAITADSPVKLEVDQVIFNPNINPNPVSFNRLIPIGGTVYRAGSGGAPYLKITTSGIANANDSFQFQSGANNFAFFSKDDLYILSEISANLIISGAAYKPGLVAHANSGVAGEYNTLKVEVDKANLNIVPGDIANNKKIPAAIVGTPCPPNWNPF